MAGAAAPASPRPCDASQPDRRIAACDVRVQAADVLARGDAALLELGSMPTAADSRPSCTAVTALEALSDGDLRQYVEAIDTLLEHAMRARHDMTLGAGPFGAIVRWLRAQELAAHAEAGRRRFTDAAVHNYWHRGRLKFPTATAQAVRRLETP